MSAGNRKQVKKKLKDFPVDFTHQVKHPDGKIVYLNAFKKGLSLDPILTVSEWAEKHRVLPSKSSSEPGQYRVNRTPYLREILDKLSPSSRTEKVIFGKPSQIGGTEAGNNWVLYCQMMNPGPMMMVQPTVELAKRWSVQRLAPSIAMIPQIQELIGDPKSRQSNNTILTKEFGSGGVLIATGANSSVGLRSMPVRYLFCDEISAFPSDCGEGNPLRLAEARTATYGRRKIFYCSTPTVKGVCAVEREYLSDDSSQKKFHVPCPHCETYQPLEFKGIKWEKDAEGKHLPETTKYECQTCSELIPESKKTWMLSRGKWVAQNPIENPRIEGYWLNGLYSPIGWKSWANWVQEFLECKEDRFLLRSWTNSFGETWEEQGEGIQWEYLYTRREDYTDAELPSDKICLLTAGLDTQDDRIAIEVIGWCPGEESYSILYEEIYGDPGTQIPWKKIDEILERDFIHPSGIKLKIASAMVDSGGHHADSVYRFSSARQFRRVFACKGSNQPGKPIVNKPTRLGKGLGHLYSIGTDTAKEQIYSRLKVETPGPGYCHFPITYDQEFFRQLTAEKVVTRLVKGFPVRQWVKDYRRNEVLDCRVYGTASFLALNPNLELLSAKVSTDEHIKEKVKPQKQRRVVKRSGWVSGLNRF